MITRRPHSRPATRRTQRHKIRKAPRPPPGRLNDKLRGKDNFAADREMGDKILAIVPTARTAARENRAFMGRAVRFLTREAGIRQFLDTAPACRRRTTCTR
jgi:hypothetical protein